MRAGDAERAIPDGTGELDLPDGELGRARREGAARAGLEDRGMPPIRDAGPGTGDPERGIPVINRVTCDGGAGVSPRSGLLGPATRRSRSSNCVLSFGDKWPTKDQIFSPTRT